MKKPNLSKSQIWNMSVGFMGIQCGFALQNGFGSRILQTFGADVHDLNWFWLVAPFTGLIVQPIIGHYSDQTWNKLGRRKPYFLTGAILAMVGLVFLPNAGGLATVLPVLLLGAGFLMIMDVSFNIAMEPFRALVADMLPDRQRTAGFSAQTVLIGVGAVIGSSLPSVMTSLGVSNQAPEGIAPDNVIYSFYVGAFLLIATILWTLFTTKEYAPKEFNAYHGTEETEEKPGFGEIFKNIGNMPKKMKQLATVQFFSWFALFSMWVYTTSAVSTHVFGLPIEDSSSKTFNDAGDLVGTMFAVYNFVSAIYAFALPAIARKLGRKTTHAMSLIIGGLSLASIFLIGNPDLLLIPMIGVGIAWASILAMPYAMLANAIPNGKMGIYMGIFNFFIVLPQIFNGIIGGWLVKYTYNDQPILAIVVAGVCFIIAAFATFLIDDKEGDAVAKVA